ncbi:MAG TPA: sulfotransferase family 2 domain-containing protein [Bacillus sp. (in: firmicutes)]|nr:sulfotransferase family 2 domain-containing protein [Bacillus sp. (in: firmicutes)]
MEHMKTMNLMFKRMPNYHDSFPIILMWSHKSGCTTLLNWFFHHINLLDEAKKYHPWVHQYEVEVFKNNDDYAQDLVNLLLSGKKEVYKLVRNPYKRAVSAFLMLYYQDEPYWYGVWKTIRTHHFGHSRNQNGISFKQFLYYLKDTGADISSTNHHFAEQYIDGEEKYIDHYIYLEDFRHQIPAIEEKYKLKQTDLTQFYSSHNTSRYMTHKGNYAEVSITDPAFPVFPTYSSFYDEETKKLVDEIYQRDFEMYGYEKKFPLYKST